MLLLALKVVQNGDVKRIKEIKDLGGPEEILSILESLRKSKAKVRLWQKVIDQDSVEYGHISEIRAIDGIVVLEPLASRTFKILPNEVIYFHSHHRTSLFKSSVVFSGPSRIEVLIPEVVKISEGRRESRQYYERGSQESSRFYCIDKKGHFKGRVLDTSTHGLAMAIDACAIESIKESSSVVVSSSVHCMNERIAIVRNISKIEKSYLGKQEYRIGLEFDKSP